VLHVGINLALYTALRRRITWLTSERGILLYQALSSVVLIVVGFAAVSMHPNVEVVAGLVAATALHGIYSLSFLELWSLAEGSYSLSILERVEQATRQGEAVDVSGLEGLGGAKKEQRLGSLERLGLIRDTADQVTLTHRGQRVARILAGVARSAGVARTE
jgi:hypothetical protein